MDENGSRDTVPSACRWNLYDRSQNIDLVRIKGGGWQWHDWKTGRTSITYVRNASAWNALKDKNIQWNEPV